MEMRDLKAQYNRHKKEIDSAISNVLQNARFIGGDEVSILEKRLADYIGVKHCISCANGTEAMTLVMMAWEINEGDAVFVPDFTFFSTAEVVSLRNATPIFVDVDWDTFNIDTEKLEKAIIHTLEQGLLKPKAITPVDIFGLPANHLEINRIAKKYDLLVLEDGAQGFGGSINGKKACSFGHAATTSFFPAKPLGCYGDGGAIFTDDDSLAEIVRSYKVHGKGKTKYDNIRIGLNSRLDTIQAAILNVKLDAFIEHELEEVNKVYKMYNERLRNVVSIPIIPEGYISSFAQYTIKLNSSEEREQIQLKLKRNSIPSMIYYVKPMHKQQAFCNLELNEDNYTVTNKLCEIVLSLPIHPYLTADDIEQVCDELIRG